MAIPSANPPVEGIEGEVSVTSSGKPLAGAKVVTLYPNKTWIEGETDTFGRVSFGFHSQLPITVFCAASGHGAGVVRDWHPPDPLTVELGPLPQGGSEIFPEETGHLPNLTGRLNPILDNLDPKHTQHTTVLGVFG